MTALDESCGEVLHAFGRALWELRHERGLNQRGLAERAGMRQPNISMIERGLQNPPLTVICRLAWALGITPPQLIGAAALSSLPRRDA